MTVSPMATGTSPRRFFILKKGPTTLRLAGSQRDDQRGTLRDLIKAITKAVIEDQRNQSGQTFWSALDHSSAE